MEHTFTATIKQILEKHFGNKSEDIFEISLLLQYLNLKTKSANKGAKANLGSFQTYSGLHRKTRTATRDKQRKS